MKRFYVTLLYMIAFMLSASAITFTFTINIDTPENVEVKVNSALIELLPGDNVAVGEAASEIGGVYVTVEAKPNCRIVKVERYKPEQDVPFNTWTDPDYARVNINDTEGGRLVIETATNAEVQTAKLNVDMDGDPALVKFQCGPDKKLVDLVRGQQVIPFDPATEATYYVSHVDVTHQLYQVTLNGIAIERPSYGFTVADGDNLVITPDFPDEDVALTFSYPAELTNLVNKVTINGDIVDDFDGKTLQVPMGASVHYWLDDFNYTIKSVKHGTQEIDSPYSPFYIPALRQPMEVNIDAAYPQEIEFTLNANDPSHVTVLLGRDEFGIYSKTVDIAAGTNKIVVADNRAFLIIKPRTNTVIDKTTIHYGSTYDVLPLLYTQTDYGMQVFDGLEISIETFGENRQSNLVIYVDNAEEAQVGFTPQLRTGYQVIPFCDADMPMMLSVATLQGEATGAVYVNDYKVQPNYEGGPYSFSAFDDNSILKIYTAQTDPLPAKVSFVIDEGVSTAGMTVKRDLITDIAMWRGGFSCMPGTLVQISVAEDSTLHFSVNGDELACDINGLYSFNTPTEGDVVVEITDSSIGAVEDVLNQEDTMQIEIFTLDGRRIHKPEPGSIVIRRQGSSFSKYIIQ